MARELYVYWKVPRAEAGRARAAATALVESLARQQPGLQARLLCRADETGERATFMEVYRAEPAGVTAALQAGIEAAAAQALAGLGAPQRHVEVFDSLAG